MRHSVLKYVRVRDYLRSLVTHELSAGDAIPSERLLCERFKVSRMTVRQAVDALVVDGLLQREQGRGTFVAPTKMDLEVRLASFGEDMRRRGMEPLSKVLVAEEVPASHDIADALELLPGELVFYLYRVRYADGEPMAIEQTWLPSRLVPGLFEGGAPDSIYGELRRRGLDPEWGEDTVAATEVDAQDAELLGLRTGRAVLRLARRTFAGETACCYSRSSYRADRYELWVPLRAPRRSLTPHATSDHQRDDGAAESKIGSRLESKVEPTTGSGSGTESRTKSGTGTKRGDGTDPKTEFRTKTDTGTKTESRTRSKAKPRATRPVR